MCCVLTLESKNKKLAVCVCLGAMRRVGAAIVFEKRIPRFPRIVCVRRVRIGCHILHFKALHGHFGRVAKAPAC